jgi:hypothetical protein
MQNASATSSPVPAPTPVFAPSAPPTLAPPASLVATPGIHVANSQSTAVQTVDGITVHAVPTLDGFGLLVVSLLLGFAAFWIWRRQQ